MIEREVSYREVVTAIEAYPFTSPIAETLRQTLYTHTRNSTLTTAFLQEMISTNEEIVQRCTTTLEERAQLTNTLQPLLEMRIKSLEDVGSEIATQVETLDTHFHALIEWASTEETIGQHIQTLNKPTETDDPEWNTDTLQPFRCQNTFPLDLTAFADTVREFTVRQIAAYTNAIPLFYAKEYNFEALMCRVMVAFVNDQ
jgi:hypothetical protein